MFSHNLTMFCSKNESSFLKGSNTSHFDSRRMICQFSVGSNSLKMFHASLNYFSLNIRSTQSLQKFGLQSLSNHFKLVLMKRNLSRPNWCYWRIIQGQLQICPCIILHRLTIAWRLPDDCLSEKLRRKLKQIVFKSWNRASYLLTNNTN